MAAQMGSQNEPKFGAEIGAQNGTKREPKMGALKRGSGDPNGSPKPERKSGALKLESLIFQGGALKLEPLICWEPSYWSP